MKPVTIYTISNADTGYVYYVGATTMKLENRMSGHRNTSNNRKMKILMQSGVRLEISAIDETDTKENAAQLEQYWIFQFRSWGFNLMNSHSNLLYSDTLRKGLIVKRDNEPIEQYTIGGRLIRTWKNIYDAAENGFNECLLSYVLIGNKKTHSGYRWKFSKDKEFSPERIYHWEYKQFIKDI